MEAKEFITERQRKRMGKRRLIDAQVLLDDIHSQCYGGGYFGEVSKAILVFFEAMVGRQPLVECTDKELEKKIDFALMEIRSMSTSDGLIRAEIAQSILERLKNGSV